MTPAFILLFLHPPRQARPIFSSPLLRNPDQLKTVDRDPLPLHEGILQLFQGMGRVQARIWWSDEEEPEDDLLVAPQDQFGVS